MGMISETRKVPGFTGISLRGYGDLEIEQRADSAGQEVVVVEADDSIISRIITEVRGGRLVLGFSMPWFEWLTWWWQWIFLPNKRIRFRLVAAKIEFVEIAGAGRATAERLSSDRLQVRITGAGRISLSGLSVRDLASSVTGAGDVELAGAAERHDAHITGAGNVHAARLETKRTTVSISGSGNFTASVSEELDARISGAGNVSYRGTPRVTQRITGAGRVREIR